MSDETVDMQTDAMEPDGVDGGALADLLASVLADNADAILLLDAGGVIQVANGAAATLFGRSADDLVGRPFGYPVVEGGFAEIEVQRPGAGATTVEMHVSETEWGGRPFLVATLRDVTVRVRAASALRDFVSMASHEFRTPLTAINGFATTIVDNLERLSMDDIARYAGIIADQSDRLARLANDLLAISRLDSGELPVYEEDLPLMPAVERAVRSVGPSVHVELAVDEALAVRCDADHLRDMLTNYLANAVKYGREPFTIAADPEGDMVRVTVADVGDGVPEEFRDRLFERFARARTEATRDKIGTGLGLAVVRGLAQMHGGEAGYEPNEPTGSRFWFTVPRATGEVPGEVEDARGNGGPPA